MCQFYSLNQSLFDSTERFYSEMGPNRETSNFGGHGLKLRP